jgi:hypothetical protein
MNHKPNQADVFDFTCPKFQKSRFLSFGGACFLAAFILTHAHFTPALAKSIVFPREHTAASLLANA